MSVKQETKKLRKKTAPAQYLDEDTITQPADHALNKNAFYRGEFTKPARNLEELDARRTYNAQVDATTGAPLEPLGKLKPLEPSELLAFQKDLERQEINIFGHKVAKWAVDPNKPADQARIANIDPELWSEMNAPAEDRASFSIFLEQLLRKGEVTTEEDRLFLASLFDPQVVIPEFPLWDMDGTLMELSQWNDIWSSAQKQEEKFTYGALTRAVSVWTGKVNVANDGPLGDTELQRKVKYRILQHLLPALREKNVDLIASIAATLDPATNQLNVAQVNGAAVNNFKLNAAQAQFFNYLKGLPFDSIFENTPARQRSAIPHFNGRRGQDTVRNAASFFP